MAFGAGGLDAAGERGIDMRLPLVDQPGRVVAGLDSGPECADALPDRGAEPGEARQADRGARIVEKARVGASSTVSLRAASSIREQAAGYEGQIAAKDREIALLSEEARDVRSLVERGHSTKPRRRALERAEAEIVGARARNRAQVARLGQTAGETRLQIVRLGNTRLTELTTELREVEARLADLDERLTAARDVLARTQVVAPVAGTVVGLGVFTHGAVIAPGQRLMGIVPAGERLVVEARVAPTDIDSVAVGLPAQVRLTSFSLLTTPPLDGHVIRVSADAFSDERTGAAWYEARIDLDPGQPGLADLDLVSGMPAEVMIVTGSSTPLEYLLKPILTSFDRALRED